MDHLGDSDTECRREYELVRAMRDLALDDILAWGDPAGGIYPDSYIVR
jgi:hypothetical protein